MSDIQISGLPAASTPLGDSDIYHAQQGGVDAKITNSEVANYINNESPTSPVVVAVTASTHTVSTVIRKQLIVFTIASQCTVTMPGTFGEAKELVFRNTSSSSANVIGFGDGLVLLPNQEATYIWNGTAWIKRYFSFNSIYQISNSDYVGLDGDGFNEIHINPTTANHAYTPPNPATNFGRKIKVVNTGGGTYKITANRYGSSYIIVYSGNEAWQLTSFELLQAGDYFEITSDGTNWIKTNAPYWHKIDDPGTGNLTSKTDTWTVDDFSSGLTATYTGLPLGSAAVECAISQFGTKSAIYYRKYNDSNISNTPNASGDYSHVIMLPVDDTYHGTLWISSDFKIQLTVTDSGTDLYVRYPIAYLQ